MMTDAEQRVAATCAESDAMSAEPCQPSMGGHKWVHLHMTRTVDTRPTCQIRFVQIDQFFCEKCLETKDVMREEYSRETPLWFAREGT